MSRSKNYGFRFLDFFLCLWLAVSCQLGRAQAANPGGAVRGIVSDSSGAVTVGASVVLTSRAHGGSQISISNSAGIFVFPSQAVGLYTIEVTAPGFRKEIVEPVLVQVGQTTTVNARLQPGSGSESVTVTGESPLLQTENSNLSSVIDRDLLSGLPLSGRRFLDFALLVPNASPDGEQGLVSFAGEQGGQDTGYANANGSNSFSVDGGSATSNYFGAARGGERVPYIFGENAVQEFQVAISPYRSEYGGAATGFVNVVTRSGSNDLHGDAFYYNRNSGTGANDAVNKANGIPRPANILQQFGGSLGGPVLPSRAWFFVDFEQQRQKNPISVINNAFADVDQVSFGVPDGVQLPSPNAAFPAASNFSDVPSDTTDPVYLQGVANALNAIHSSLGVHPRFRNDWALFSKIDYRDAKDDRFYLSLNWNRFDSPSGAIVGNSTTLFGNSTLANAFVRDYHASAGWSHAYGSSLLNELHGSFSRDDQFFTPTGLVDPHLPAIVVSSGGDAEAGGALQMGNAGFAGGRTNEALWQISDHVSYLRGKHTFKFGVEFTYTHLTDLAFGGFDPDAAKQNGTLRGTYSFSNLSNFAIGKYDTFVQSTGQPKFSFNVPYLGLYIHDTYQLRPGLTLDLGLREDFQVYPQPKENSAFPLTGQFANQYQRVAPRFGLAWQPLDKTVVRAGLGMFYENLNGLNYRNAVVSNGLLSQQASAIVTFDGSLPADQQKAIFPNQISDPSLFSTSNISLVDPHFRFPYILQGSLQIEREVLPDTVVTLGTSWTHGVHLIASSAYDLNLVPPTGTTTYVLCQDQTTCTGSQVVLPALNSADFVEGRISSSFNQINALISPGINNYNSFFAQAQRRLRHGLAFHGSYTFSKNIMSRGVDFNNQFDFRNTHAPYLLDQRHRVSIAGTYQPDFGRNPHSAALRGLASDWTISTVMQFGSGRPYAALLAPTDDGNILNNTAALQSTANSALGINGQGPSPFAGLNSFYGPWTQQIDLGLARRFHITEQQTVSLNVQAFNLMNHANYYVANGNGVVATQFVPVPITGDCGEPGGVCGLVPNDGFGTLQRINALNGPRVLQFSLKYNF
ncbi:MAG TPA: carboxypeptidase regulatory-like domain-containing protein [Terriglobales bacterium]|nr:carboxypeptidase regulatory-like domain-containing protein [Terriglobales bacterium]